MVFSYQNKGHVWVLGIYRMSNVHDRPWFVGWDSVPIPSSSSRLRGHDWGRSLTFGPLDSLGEQNPFATLEKSTGAQTGPTGPPHSIAHPITSVVRLDGSGS